MTPTDAMAFIGFPPGWPQRALWMPEADEVHVSVAFTWDVVRAEEMAEAWRTYYPAVKIGGPALGGPLNGFEPGLYVKEGVTFTHRGCPNHCPWCLVPQNEGDLQLLPITPGWVNQDNNLLATPREHQEQVYAMHRAQSRATTFAGGLDARLVDDWVADQLRQLRIKEVFLAADTEAALTPLLGAVDRLSFLGRNKLRCYVLIGFDGETMEQATRRLEAVWAIGCLPFAQLYQPPDHYIRYSREWKQLARQWSRPAIMRAMHKG